MGVRWEKKKEKKIHNIMLSQRQIIVKYKWKGG